MKFKVTCLDKTFKEGDPAREVIVYYKGFGNKAEVRLKAHKDLDGYMDIIQIEEVNDEPTWLDEVVAFFKRLF